MDKSYFRPHLVCVFDDNISVVCSMTTPVFSGHLALRLAGETWHLTPQCPEGGGGSGVGNLRVCRWFRFAQLAKGKKFRP
jgi:hypothetical protein